MDITYRITTNFMSTTLTPLSNFIPTSYGKNLQMCIEY